MAWIDISSTRTAKNKPLSQSLMDDIRTNLDWLYDGNSWVGRNHVKTTYIERDKTGTGAVDFDDCGAYGFWPRWKISNGGETFAISVRLNASNTTLNTRAYISVITGGTVTGRMTYITASRFFPTAWMMFDKNTNQYIEGYFAMETLGKENPFKLNYEPDKHVIYCFQIGDKKTFDMLNFNDSHLEGIRWGLITGKLKIKPGAKPLLPENECPPLYADGVILADLEVCE
jgi:hypothetical protein